ncbi:ArsR/SmtB family transcription factor [Agromyces archimandritae]|uniref:Winged helix-turn-helix transcriptional regulator n=1 Tax=Agromyces archimandritae TaxID=2781962 RepID=A0A975FK87_9MICO|nr:metalloregulator ArsR/SmtB family transcription factor [Agromyces archimandritae]QTX03609.1 winged helix-turn-helix transcriptional regulator [Agromyces archimandritae]
MADIFDVVADSTRRDILAVLLDRENADAGRGEEAGEISVGEIVAELGLSQPTVSKHLKVLREAGLVGVREEGQHRFYHLVREPLDALEDWLIPFTSQTAAVDAARLADAERAEAALNEEQRALASAIGKAFAETAHQVTTVVTPKKRRGSAAEG